MRIMQLTDQYTPSIGGTERHVARLAGELTSRGHEVAVVTMGRPGLPAHEIEASGVEVFRLDAPEVHALRRAYRQPDHSFHPPMPLPGITRALQRVIGDWAPDVIHGHNWMTYSALPLRARTGVPIVHTLHDVGFACPKMTLLRPDGTACSGPAVRDCLGCAADQYSRPVAASLTLGLRASRPLNDRIDRVLAVSVPTATGQQAMFSQPIEVVPTFIPDGLAARTAGAERPAFVPDGDYLLYVGALSPHKGVPQLLEAYARLPEPRLPLVMLGVRKPNTPDLDLPGVTVVENVPHEQVMAAWAHAHLGVVPSLVEPWGQVVAEALTVGCPLIISDAVGLAPQVKAADAGLILPVGDVNALTAGIAELTTHRDYAEHLAANGTVLARGLTLSAVMDRLEQIFTEVTKG